MQTFDGDLKLYGNGRKTCGGGGGGFLQCNRYTTPTTSLSPALPVNKRTQVGHQSLPNDNLLWLFSTTLCRLKGRERLISAVADRKLFFFFKCEDTLQLLDYVKNLQNVSHHSALEGENVNPPCSATTTQ